MAPTSVAVVALLSFVVIAGAVGPCDGACANGYTCLPMQQCYDRHRAANTLNTMVMFPCSAAPGYVCCPPVPRRRVVQAMDMVDPETNKKLLPIGDCGHLGETRISVGQEAGLGQFPWMGLLAYKPNGTSGSTEYLCGATLISYRYILTAAHCVNDDRIGEPVYVRLGEHNLNNTTDCVELYCALPPVDVAIEKIIVHSMYNKPYLKNDIALLRLKDTVTPTLYTLPICLPFGLNVTGEEEKKYTVAGWGKIEDSSVRGSDVLLFTFVPSAPVSQCNPLQTEEVRPIDELQLCAGGSAGHDACKGDSGGPLMDTIADKMGTSTTYQIGIVSFGSIPCGAEVPSVYTRVSSYLTWILTNLEP